MHRDVLPSLWPWRPQCPWGGSAPVQLVPLSPLPPSHSSQYSQCPYSLSLCSKCLVSPSQCPTSLCQNSQHPVSPPYQCLCPHPSGSSTPQSPSQYLQHPMSPIPAPPVSRAPVPPPHIGIPVPMSPVPVSPAPCPSRFGRRVLLTWCYLQLGATGAGTAAAPTFVVYCLCRFLAGLAMAGVSLNSASLCELGTRGLGFILPPLPRGKHPGTNPTTVDPWEGPSLQPYYC